MYGIMLLQKKIRGESFTDDRLRAGDQPIGADGLYLPPDARSTSCPSRSATPCPRPGRHERTAPSRPRPRSRRCRRGTFGDASRARARACPAATRSSTCVAGAGARRAARGCKETPGAGATTTSPTSRRWTTATRSVRSRWSGSCARSTGRRDLRVKVALAKRAAARGADRAGTSGAAPTGSSARCFDMFGVLFVGHPDLRRILMWETYAEGPSAAEGLPAARPLQPRRADAPGARRRIPRRTTRSRNCRSPTRTRTCRPTCASG